MFSFALSDLKNISFNVLLYLVVSDVIRGCSINFIKQSSSIHLKLSGVELLPISLTTYFRSKSIYRVTIVVH